MEGENTCTSLEGVVVVNSVDDDQQQQQQQQRPEHAADKGAAVDPLEMAHHRHQDTLVLEEFAPQQHEQDDDDDDGTTTCANNGCDLLKQTIATMEESQLCFHPVHYHSFAPVSFLLWGSMRKCAACHQRLKAVLLGGAAATSAAAGGSNDQVVRCVSCGAFAHRSCAMETAFSSSSRPEDDDDGDDFALLWKEAKCPVNSGIVERMNEDEASSPTAVDENDKVLVINEPETRQDDDDAVTSSADNQRTTRTSSPQQSLFQFLSRSNLQDEVLVAAEEGNERISNDDNDDESDVAGNASKQRQQQQQQQASPPQSLFQFLSPSNFLFSGTSQGKEHVDAPIQLSVSSSDEEDDEDIMMLWTSDGPPRHWANEQALSNIHRSRSLVHNDTDADDKEQSNNNDNNDQENQCAKTPLQVDDHTFATVSRAIQENIVAHFIRRPFIERVISQDNDNGNTSSSNVGDHQTRRDRDDLPTLKDAEHVIERTLTADSSVVSPINVEDLLSQEVVEASPSKKPTSSSITKVASGTVEVARTSVAMRKKMGVVTVVGGVVGGVAGLCVAGPAGAVIGAKAGQTAGLLGLLLEGSMTVGVLVAGVAAGSLTATHIQEQQQKRVLTIGEDGVKQKLLLVRPNVSIDPEWEVICKQARRSHFANHRSFSILPSPHGAMTKKERMKRDSDIVETDESEIATAEKVFLLVSRSLNDKESMPGHVYKCLIQEYRARETMPTPQIQEMQDGGACQGCATTPSETDNDGTEGEVSNEASGEAESLIERVDEGTECGNDEKAINAMRGRRQDAHAMIKHVTATLLEARPGFASSPSITELSATAVEALVFGEVYDSVFEEVAGETRECDNILMSRIRTFDQEHGLLTESASETEESGHSNGLISQPAVDALLMLTEAHSAVDKLRYCVEFLERISIHFTETSNLRPNGKPASLSADSLLKMVCQHIIAAKVPNINAEILFLEEFARDEQLLRGKEGYALVTLQASLHFLNTSSNFDEDIFGQDEADDSTHLEVT